MNIKSKNTGFTLIEIAIVLLVVTVILGYTLAMVPVQQELKQYRQAEREMDWIIESLYAYAQTNSHLPCPAANTSDGFECRNDGTAGNCNGNDTSADVCDLWFGFLPGKTLGLDGKYSSAGLLLDPWGQPYLYQVTDGGATVEDFIFVDGMRTATIANLVPDLVVCNADPSSGAQGATDTSCGGAAAEIIDESPAVVLSTGKDTLGDTGTNSWVQRENLDNSSSDRA
nr:type II secretion system protein [Gammaproteobacteria bacterium]